MFKRKLDNVSVEAGIDVGRRERSIKALKSVVKDKDVEKLFLNLEREKVALVLAIVDIDSSLLHSLGLSVEETAIIARSIAVGVDELRLLLIAVSPPENSSYGIAADLANSDSIWTICPQSPNWQIQSAKHTSKYQIARPRTSLEEKTSSKE